MNDSERITDLEKTINQILMELTFAKTENLVLGQLVTTFLREALDEEMYRTFINEYLSRLSEAKNDCFLDTFPEILYPTDDYQEMMQRKQEVCNEELDFLKKVLLEDD